MKFYAIKDILQNFSLEFDRIEVENIEKEILFISTRDNIILEKEIINENLHLRVVDIKKKKKENFTIPHKIIMKDIYCKESEDYNIMIYDRGLVDVTRGYMYSYNIKFDNLITRIFSRYNASIKVKEDIDIHKEVKGSSNIDDILLDKVKLLNFKLDLSRIRLMNYPVHKLYVLLNILDKYDMSEYLYIKQGDREEYIDNDLYNYIEENTNKVDYVDLEDVIISDIDISDYSKIKSLLAYQHNNFRGELTYKLS